MKPNFCNEGHLFLERGLTPSRLTRDAAKVSYLVRLIQTGTNQVKHYSPEMDTELAEALIEDQSLNKLNRIKKISLEAFFYCRQLEQLAQ